MSSHIKTFNQLFKSDVAIAGGKGASLGEMTKTGIPVPPGFVVLASAFDRFLQETELGSEIEAQLHKVSHQDVNAVEKVSEDLRELIMNEEMPKDIAKEIMAAFVKLRASLVAVRSSATAEDSTAASWAGELETYLNVKKGEILKRVQDCWSSLFTPRAIFYRFEKKLHKTNVSVAVVVQEMVQSEVSGITFTVHPVTKDPDQMIIEAGWGLGEAIVGGKITPDSYVVQKNTSELLEKNVSEQMIMIVRTSKGTAETVVPKPKRKKQKLSDVKVLRLAKLCMKIEQHYKKPQDIEWALAKGKFYVLQSRPITTL